MKSTLSVVLATYNEGGNLKDCLESVRGWCDEMIIVDGSSTDKTVEIAKSYGARVIITNNPPLFHINKQIAIDAATSSWILQLDADERLTPELRQEIDRAINSANVNGYWLPRKNFFLGRFLMKGGVYPDYTLRLYRRGKGKLPQKDVHEQAVVVGRTEHLRSPLLHMADLSVARYFVRFDRYTSLLATQIKEEDKSGTLIKFVKYVMVKPTTWFLMTYFRHLGFLDSWQGFLFALFSALRFPVAFFKWLKIKL